MKVLLTGCDGQVGTSLKNKLEASVELIAFKRKNLDITNEQQVKKMVLSIKPDIIINAAAYTAVDNAEDNEQLAYKVNRDGPKFLAQAAEEINASIIHISTDYVFDGLCETTYTELDPVNPQGVYGASKLAGEAAVKLACRKHLILRTSWVFSEYGGNFVKTMLRLATERDELSIVSDQIGGPTYAGDIANAIISIVKQTNEISNEPWGLYHYSGSPHISWFEFACFIFEKAVEKELIEKAPVLNPITSDEYPTKAKRPKNSKLNCNKINSQFGIKESDWKDAVSSVIDSYLEAK